ncbi:MAG: hypothetical protein WD075_08720 [Rhodospirillales bacterium]
MTYLVPIWMTLAAIGGGLAVLRALGLLSILTRAEHLAIGFVLGIGTIGWLAFFAGLGASFGSPAFIAILLVLTAGLVFLKSPAQQSASASPASLQWILIGGLVLVAAMDVAEALAPAADADSLAYHFETPRLFLSEHKIYAIPRALDGVTQLLLQMTYGVALSLGGKTALNLWAMVSGWGVGALFYVLAQRHMSRLWALTGTLIVLTTPAVIYSAGTGQVEVRLAAFALLGTYAAARALGTEADNPLRIRWVILAGLAAGFFAGAKITGLLFIFTICLVLLLGQNRIRHAMVFSIVVAVAGTQWYLFNWYETGDPLYPLFWQHVRLSPDYPWNEFLAAQLDSFRQSERPEPVSLMWYLAYPFRTIIAPLPSFESLRTGLGPAVLILLPFAALAMIQTRRVHTTLSFRVLLVAFIFYTLWYFIGPSLRVRHLLPIYPLVLLCCLAGVSKFLAGRDVTKWIVSAGIAILLVVQIAGQGVFSKKFITYLLTDEQPADFLEANITGYNIVAWLNRNLSADDRVLILNREWSFVLDVPYFMAHAANQGLISIYPEATDTHRFIAEMAAQGITYLAIPKSTVRGKSLSAIGRFLTELEPSGCIRKIAERPALSINSRTLPGLGNVENPYVILAISPDTCRPS